MGKFPAITNLPSAIIYYRRAFIILAAGPTKENNRNKRNKQSILMAALSSWQLRGTNCSGETKIANGKNLWERKELFTEDINISLSLTLSLPLSLSLFPSLSAFPSLSLCLYLLLSCPLLRDDKNISLCFIERLPIFFAIIPKTRCLLFEPPLV